MAEIASEEQSQDSHALRAGRARSLALEMAVAHYSRHVGALGDWMMGGVSATVVLAIGNAERLVSAIEPAPLIAGLLLLLVSIALVPPRDFPKGASDQLWNWPSRFVSS